MQYLGISCMPPPGSIVSYIGTNDPEGWIICDGILRTATDNKYKNLVPLLGGTGNSITPPDLRDRFLRGNSTTSILTKAGSATITLTNNNIPQHNHIIDIIDNGHSHPNTVSQYATHTHTFSISDSGHTHANTISETRHTHAYNIVSGDNNSPSKQGFGPSGDSANLEISTHLNPPRQETFYIEPSSSGVTMSTIGGAQTGVSAGLATNYATTVSLTTDTIKADITATSQDAGGGTSFSIIPSFTVVNYIIKY